jgi:hypothetical protein
MDEHRYTALNAWTSFWRGARVLLHQNLTPVTSLARGKQLTWGRITDFRRMGATLRLVGGILLELGLRRTDAASRQLFIQVSKALKDEGVPHSVGPPPEFYTRTLGEHNQTEPLVSIIQIRDELKKRIHGILSVPPVPDYWEKYDRINVNAAAADLQLIFAYLSDRPDLLDESLSDSKSVGFVGSRSPLYRVNGNELFLPVAYLHHGLRSADPQDPRAIEMAPKLDARFKLLALSEKALFCSYLCYRDCIPDYTYSQTCIHIGELYAATLYKLGTWTRCDDVMDSPATRSLVSSSVDHLTEYAKRFLMKAIDILKREQEQNRNTFHLMSEAWFNLGDILLIRLLAITGGTPELPAALFGNNFTEQMKRYFNEIQDSQSSTKEMSDVCPEDLRRQIAEAYQQGLRFVQDEMNDYRARYRVPGDVYYANRNIMDPVLHFRICRAVRLRHAGTGQEIRSRATAPGEPAQTLAERFIKTWHTISDLISCCESPQAFGHSNSKSGFAPSSAWVRQLLGLIKFSNKVRTDRGPIQVENGIMDTVGWLKEDKIVDPGTRSRFVFFE